MRVKYDPSVDATYITLSEEIPAGAVAKTVPTDPLAIHGEMNLDFDSNGVLIGIDVMDASKRLPEALLEDSE